MTSVVNSRGRALARGLVAAAWSARPAGDATSRRPRRCRAWVRRGGSDPDGVTNEMTKQQYQ
eukprot:1166686-Pyramimonas_sp.AAC.1